MCFFMAGAAPQTTRSCVLLALLSPCLLVADVAVCLFWHFLCFVFLIILLLILFLLRLLLLLFFIIITFIVLSYNVFLDVCLHNACNVFKVTFLVWMVCVALWCWNIYWYLQPFGLNSCSWFCCLMLDIVFLHSCICCLLWFAQQLQHIAKKPQSQGSQVAKRHKNQEAKSHKNIQNPQKQPKPRSGKMRDTPPREYWKNRGAWSTNFLYNVCQH